MYLEDSEETPILGSQVIQVAVSCEKTFKSNQPSLFVRSTALYSYCSYCVFADEVKELINEEQDPVIHQGPKLELLGLTWVCMYVCNNH